MKFRYIALTGFIILAIASVILLPGVFSQLKNTPEINYYKNHPDVDYIVFSGCKSHPENLDECYAAYSAAVYLASSSDCSPAGIEIKRRFKRLVESSKEEYITEEIISDCRMKNPSFFEKLFGNSK
ncbi:hypothetical protein IFU23_24370 [Pantoea agglomerans]|uniref:Uncharacterized protein n=1 Tax=Enterobacter agglomerans TaxID=549 RepID=A0ACC5PVI0_ENTAG|nr:hypothetical protein [Pantoea agglomerans]MBD8129266.1 hypothetical protein [Pantoea agglomerans]MBD8156465.1 hypothetical protein [Pantoea agglomerans]MBD8161216.1 hypothetical protein [Pantoea agglomerans]MBD8234860.1 hypothetical protein [Pantoea agglomerans]MBD8245271.1 hypothetical protein [Pantoea agglomerans]